MKKPLDIKALDVFLSAVEDRLAHLESKMGMYKDEDEEREPVSEDTIEKKGVCPECGLPEGECKCGYFDIDAKSYSVDTETKVRYVRDSAYWGVPIGTPISPGMKPQGPTSPAGRARRASMTGRNLRRSMPSTSAGSDKTPGRAAPRKRVAPKRTSPGGAGGGKKPPKTAVGTPDRGDDSFNNPPGTPIKPKRKPTLSRDGAIAVRKYEQEERGLKSPKAQAADDLLDEIRNKIRKDSSDGMVSMNIGINKRMDSFDIDGISDEERQILADKFDSIDRGKFQDRWQGKLDKIRDALGAGGGAGPDRKPSKPNDAEPTDVEKRRAARNQRNREARRSQREGRGPIPRIGQNASAARRSESERLFGAKPQRDVTAEDIESAGQRVSERNKPKKPVRESDSRFQKDENDRYTAAKAEDFSVDAVAKELGSINPEGSIKGSGTLEDPIDVGKDVELAHKLLSEGKHIRMDSHMELGTLIAKINELADDAKKRGDKAPEYDFCKVSVPKTNLFCIESKGVPRVKMPQFKGDPHEGTFAAKRMAEKTAEVQKRIDAGETDKNGEPLKLPREADIEPEFRELLDKMGIKHEVSKVPAANLKATQENLDGAKVSGMMRAIKNGEMPQDVLDSPIFVTKDGYIVDGHHRWAALVALDMEDGKQGDIDIPVEVIDGDIGYVLDIANGFADIGGIKRKGLGAAADGVGGKKPTTGRSGESVTLDGVGTVVQSDNTQGKKWWDIRDEFSTKDDDDCGCSGNIY